jgi:hypothetical protein
MTHKPGHKTHPEYDKLSKEAKARYDKATSPDFFNSKSTESGKVND